MPASAEDKIRALAVEVCAHVEGSPTSPREAAQRPNARVQMRGGRGGGLVILILHYLMPWAQPNAFYLRPRRLQPVVRPRPPIYGHLGAALLPHGAAPNMLRP